MMTFSGVVSLLGLLQKQAQEALHMKKIMLAGAGFLALTASSLFGSSICPAANGGTVGGEGVSGTYITNTVIVGGVVQNNTGCNVLITFGAGGSVVTTFP